MKMRWFNMRNTLLTLFTSFFVPLPIMIIIFQLYTDLFYGYMDIFWVDGPSNALPPTIFGWILIVAAIAFLVPGLILAHSKDTALSHAFAAIAGVLLQLILTAIYVKTVW
jgi:hypothetical protein